MPQSFAQIYLHIVFATKCRQPFLNDKQLRKLLFAHMAGICRQLGSPSIITGGVEDHVHLLVRHGREVSVADLVRHIKGNSSRWIKEADPSLASFRWQRGYAVFSVSPSIMPRVKTYIENQEEHHRKRIA